jgi:septal ring-binding cell division protein DamX
VEAFLKRQVGDDGLQHVYVYETVIDDRPYIGVLYGEFPSLTAAREALENLPGTLKRLGPFIRNVRDISIVG